MMVLKKLWKNILPIVTCIITSSLIRLLSLLEGKKTCSFRKEYTIFLKFSFSELLFYSFEIYSVKLGCSEKATKFEKIFHLIFPDFKWKIFSNFVLFSYSPNFKWLRPSQKSWTLYNKGFLDLETFMDYFTLLGSNLPKSFWSNYACFSVVMAKLFCQEIENSISHFFGDIHKLCRLGRHHGWFTI